MFWARSTSHFPIGVLAVLGLMTLVALVSCGRDDVGEKLNEGGTGAVAPTVAPTSSWVLSYEQAPCQFQIPPGQTVECGYLIVPEDRGQSGGPTIRLHVGVFRTQSDDKAPDPIVFLHAGPGANALEWVPLTFNYRFAPFLADRDFIIFDQRGTGLSQPALDCPEHLETVLETLDQDLGVEEKWTLETESILDSLVKSLCRSN